jgi:hypothetical protein
MSWRVPKEGLLELPTNIRLGGKWLAVKNVLATLYIVCDPASETPFSFNQVYSMIKHTKLSEYLNQMAKGENRVGSKWSGERERECRRLTE